MTVAVVYLLEGVEVHHKNADLTVVIIVAREHVVDIFVESVAVVEVGKFVGKDLSVLYYETFI